MEGESAQAVKTRKAPGEGTCFRRKDQTWQASASMGTGPDGKRFRLTSYGNARRQAWDRLQAKLELSRRPVEGGEPHEGRAEPRGYVVGLDDRTA